MAEKILVVDDEESIRFTFTVFLSDEGYEVTTAENFNQAMALLLSTDFDLIFVDIILEGETGGIDLLHEIAKMGLNVPVIIITGAPSLDTATESLRRGAFDYIIKPVHQDTILRTVSIALKHKSLLDEKEKCRRNFESVFRSVKEGIITFDRTMAITEINDSALKICDLRRETVLGNNALTLPRTCRGKCLESLQKSFASGQPHMTTYVECFANSSRNQVVSIMTSPLLGANKEFTGIVMLIHDETQLVELRRNLERQNDDSRLLGNTAAIRQLRTMLNNLADIQTTVLVTGESGTGKEIVVDELHHASERRNFPLVKVNCAALSEELLESELFGHVRGAFTGAIRDKVGRFQRADGGTLFLDEIGDISLRMQARLLRVIETMEFERVGESTPLKVDVRIVTATNKNLKNLVAEGKFREDLYYRLKVVEITLPPLRERQDDIPLLANHFLTRYNQKLNKQIKGISADTLKLLLSYNWPGNVRELENAIEHAFVCCHDDVISTSQLPAELFSPPEGTFQPEPLNEDQEFETLRLALEKSRWNKSKAADLLGISRRTIYRRIEKYGPSFLES